MPGSEFVWLQHGYVAPIAVFDLVLACERAGIGLRVVDGDVIASSPGRPQLITDELVCQLRAWKPHVLAVLKYTADDRHLSDPPVPFPEHGPIVHGGVRR